jgi:hypothetical protein
MEHPSVKNGIFGAIAVIIVYLVLWFIDPKILVKYGSWFGIIIGLYFMYKAAKEARDMNEGFISFNDAFKYLFLTMALLTIIVSLFNYILYNFIDPGLLEVQKEVALETAQKMADTFGNEDMVEQISDNLDESMFKLTLGKVLQGWLVGLIFGAIASAIMGAIMKKKNPSFDEYA